MCGTLCHNIVMQTRNHQNNRTFLFSALLLHPAIDSDRTLQERACISISLTPNTPATQHSPCHSFAALFAKLNTRTHQSINNPSRQPTSSPIATPKVLVCHGDRSSGSTPTTRGSADGSAKMFRTMPLPGSQMVSRIQSSLYSPSSH